MSVTRPRLAELLDLAPHPEGGWFRKTWSSAVRLSPPHYSGERSTATAIYFLLSPGERSRWHVVPGGVWQSAEPAADEPALVSCVVSPGFDYADFHII